MKYKKNFYQIKPNDVIFKKILQERDEIGYYKLPFQDITSITKYSKTIQSQEVVVVGMGGSSLGVKSIYDFLISTKELKKLVFLDTVDPLKINYSLRNVNLEDAHFLFISKSGKTIEVLSLLKYIDSKVSLVKKNTTIISEKNTPLHVFSTKRELTFFEIPKNVGGRFSVFSNVGLVPLAISGVDISQILHGCKKVYTEFFKGEDYYKHIIEKSRFLVENKGRFNINVVFSYSSSLESFNKWYIQLWAESLGKKNVNGTRQALTPIGLIGPDDQHSFLQLIMDGVRDKTITFIKIKNLKSNILIPESSDNTFKVFDFANTKEISFSEMLNLQADSTIESIIEEQDIPTDVITISTVDEYNIAKLMFTYQLMVSIIGQFLQINTYNQPGVEHSKKILFDKIKKLGVK